LVRGVAWALDFALVRDVASACGFALRCSDKFEEDVGFEGIEVRVYGGIGGRIEGEVIGVGIVEGGSTDRGVKVLAAQSITGFSYSVYGIPRIIDCTPSRATKKVP